jgi:hypothetical protein
LNFSGYHSSNPEVSSKVFSIFLLAKEACSLSGSSTTTLDYSLILVLFPGSVALAIFVLIFALLILPPGKRSFGARYIMKCTEPCGF